MRIGWDIEGLIVAGARKDGSRTGGTTVRTHVSPTEMSGYSDRGSLYPNLVITLLAPSPTKCQDGRGSRCISAVLSPHVTKAIRGHRIVLASYCSNTAQKCNAFVPVTPVGSPRIPGPSTIARVAWIILGICLIWSFCLRAGSKNFTDQRGFLTQAPCCISIPNSVTLPGRCLSLLAGLNRSSSALRRSMCIKYISTLDVYPPMLTVLVLFV